MSGEPRRTEAMTTRRSWLARAGGTAAGLLALPSFLRAQSAARRPFFATLISGEPSSTSVVLQTRIAGALSAPGAFNSPSPGLAGSARFEIADGSAFSSAQRTPWLPLTEAGDYIAKTVVSGLRPNTPYFYRVQYRGTNGEPVTSLEVGQFRTLPDPRARDKVAFTIFSCLSYELFYALGPPVGGDSNRGRPATAAERQRGYPGMDRMRMAAPQFLVSTGDTVYYDHPADRTFWARAVPEMRQKWHRQFSLPAVREALAATATFFMKDDHDFRTDDADNTGDAGPSAEDGKRVFLEQVPGADASGRTYRTIRVNRHLQIWMLEGRDYRSPNRTPDGPDKTIWGAEQRAWLERTLRDSDADFKIVISPTPVVGPDDSRKRDNHANTTGFRAEGDAFLNFLRGNGLASSTCIITGDRHWKYHSIHPFGVNEFCCGTVHRQNSRFGVAPGDANGTDPEARIRQPYLQPMPDGGFLQIDVEPDPEGDGASMLVRFWSENGDLQYAIRSFGARVDAARRRPAQ